MTEHQIRQNARMGRHGPEQVEALAGNVLSVLAARAPGRPAAPRGAINEVFSSRLLAAMRAPDDTLRDAAIAQLIDDGASPTDLIDIYIPAAARRMGEDWCRDWLGFAEVSIGTARLQALLRELTRRIAPPPCNDPMARQVLMAVRENDNHTLGAMVATQQLRRIGLGVHLSIGQSDAETLALIGSREFDIVMISTSKSERLESLRDFIEKIPHCAGCSVPVAVGGAAVGDCSDIASRTGATVAITDPIEALQLCNLKVPHQSARFRAVPG